MQSRVISHGVFYRGQNVNLCRLGHVFCQTAEALPIVRDAPDLTNLPLLPDEPIRIFRQFLMVRISLLQRTWGFYGEDRQ
jgi:hypothetical protein